MLPAFFGTFSCLNSMAIQRLTWEKTIGGQSLFDKQKIQESKHYFVVLFKKV